MSLQSESGWHGVFFIKSISLIFFSYLIVGCVSKFEKRQVAAELVPSWFSSRSIPKNDHEYIGYGQGKNSAQAMLRAKGDLALSIRSHVSYTLEEEVQTNNKKSVNKSQSHSKIESNLQLSNIKLIKTEQVNGVIYSAYYYSNLPVVAKIMESKISVLCAKRAHPYLSHTALFQAVKHQLFVDKNCIPEMQLVYKNNAWYLILTSANNKMSMFALGDNDFSRLFVRVKNKMLKLKASSTSLNVGGIYHFDLHLEQGGYFSLISISGDGQLQILINNRWQDGEYDITYPDLDQYEGLSAMANKQDYSQDLAILALCQSPIDLSNISSVSIKQSGEKNQYQFNQVMEKIADCEISSELIKIKGSK
jgi:hypothetical protein